MLALNTTMVLLYNLNRNPVNLSQVPGEKISEEFVTTLKDPIKVYFKYKLNHLNHKFMRIYLSYYYRFLCAEYNYYTLLASTDRPTQGP